jgi:mono/diheme cytochrome c family protein
MGTGFMRLQAYSIDGRFVGGVPKGRVKTAVRRSLCFLTLIKVQSEIWERYARQKRSCKRHNGGVSQIMRKIVIMVMGALLAGSPATAQSLTNGEHIARNQCALCHTVETESSDPKRQHRAPSFTTIAHRPEVTSQFLDSFLSRHHRGMPNFFLTYTEIGDVSAYILSLRK